VVFVAGSGLHTLMLTVKASPEAVARAPSETSDLLT
jgi:hypothetical protein